MQPTRPWRKSARSISISLMIVPMIDVIFLLLLFFVVMSSFEASARLRIDLPQPEEPQARSENSALNIAINCEYREADAAGEAGVLYRLNADAPESLDALAARLAAAKAENPNLMVVIRADRRLPFVEVRRVMEIVAACRISLMKVSIILPQE